MSIGKPQLEARIGVVIPTFLPGENPAAVIERLEAAICSVLAQSLPPQAIFVIEDGGETQPQSPIQALVTRLTPTAGPTRLEYRACRYFGTPAGPRNLGIQACLDAGCNWIAFLDHDDLWLPNKLETQIRALKAAPAAQAAHTNAEYVFPSASDERAAFVKFKADLASTFPVINGIAEVDSVLQAYAIFSTLLVSAEFFQRNGLLDETLSPCDDMDLLLRFAEARAQVIFIPEICARYRLSVDSLSMNRSAVLEAKARVLHKYLVRAHPPSDRLALEAAARLVERRLAYAAFNDGNYAKARADFHALRHKSAKDHFYHLALTLGFVGLIAIARRALALFRNCLI